MAVRRSHLLRSSRWPSGTTASFARSTAPPAPSTFYEHGIARLEDRWHGHRRDRRAVSHRGSPLRARPRYLRSRLVVSTALARPHATRRRAARAMAERSGRRVRPSVSGRHQSWSFARRWIFARRWPPPAERRATSTRSRSAHGRRRRRRPRSLWLRTAAIVLAAGIIGGVVWWVRGGPLAPLLVVIILKMILTRPSRTARRAHRPRRRKAARTARHPRRHALADRAFDLPQPAPRRRFAREMMSHGVVPSEAIRRLKRLADMLDWRRNAFFAPVAADRVVGAAPCVGDRELAPRIRPEGHRMAGGGGRVRGARARWPHMRTNMPTIRFRRSSRMEGPRGSKARASGIRSCRPRAWCATTSS